MYVQNPTMYNKKVLYMLMIITIRMLTSSSSNLCFFVSLDYPYNCKKKTLIAFKGLKYKHQLRSMYDNTLKLTRL